MTFGTRSRISGGGFAPGIPTGFTVERFVSNPVIDVDDNPNETVEQYVPAPILLPNGDIWCYVKGTGRIYAWKSIDGGETFSLENGGNPVIEPTTGWESEWTNEPSAVYDPDTDTVHLYYKGTNVAAENENWGWGHATALGSDPTDVTRDPGNPFLTSNAVEAGLGVGNITDLAGLELVVIGSVFHFYGYALWGGEYHLFHATGSDFTDPVADVVIQDAQGSDTVIQTPSVFELAGGRFGMFYARGTTLAAGRSIRFATSDDGVTWDFSNTTDVMSPTTGWEDNSVYCAHLLKTGSRFIRSFTEPRLMLYFSGYNNATGKASAGLAYLTPTY